MAGTQKNNEGPLQGVIVQAISAGFGCLVEIRGMQERSVSMKSKTTGQMETKVLHEYYAEKLATGEQLTLTVWPEKDGSYAVSGLKRGETHVAIIRSLKGNQGGLISAYKVQLD